MRSRYYLTVFFSMLGAAVTLVTFFPLQLPVWGLFLALLMAVAFLVPLGVRRRYPPLRLQPG